MRAMVRLLAAALVGIVIAVAGVALFEVLELGGVAWFGLLAVALLAVSLVDPERFYGISELRGRGHSHGDPERTRPHG